MRSFTLLACLVLLAGCGSRTGLLLPYSDVPALDASTDATFDATVDAGVDAPSDVGPDVVDSFVPDAFVPMCPNPRTVAPGEASIPVDIIWVFDSSLSMVDENTRLQTNIQIFWDAITEANVDSHVIFIAQRGYIPGPPAGFARRFMSIDDRVGSWDPLLKVLSNFPMYEPFLRPNSVVHVVAVTDDESRAIDAVSFDEEFRALLGRGYTAHAIASEQFPPTVLNPSGACYSESNQAYGPGLEYIALTEMTGGLFMSVCEEDWSRLMEPLSERVAVRIPLPCAYSLPQPPPVGIDYDPRDFSVRVQVPGEPEPRFLPRVAEASCGDGWWFVDRADRVELCPSTCAELDALDGRVTVDICPR
ncbi:MAG: hypothetical protein KF901_01880 [Myxococcales bacterium]|nr:hypothetical protein [Myxococcales bacterium]